MIIPNDTTKKLIKKEIFIFLRWLTIIFLVILIINFLLMPEKANNIAGILHRMAYCFKSWGGGMNLLTAFGIIVILLIIPFLDRIKIIKMLTKNELNSVDLIELLNKKIIIYTTNVTPITYSYEDLVNLEVEINCNHYYTDENTAKTQPYRLIRTILTFKFNDNQYYNIINYSFNGTKPIKSICQLMDYCRQGDKLQYKVNGNATFRKDIKILENYKKYDFKNYYTEEQASLFSQLSFASILVSLALIIEPLSTYLTHKLSGGEYAAIIAGLIIFFIGLYWDFRLMQNEIYKKDKSPSQTTKTNMKIVIIIKALIIAGFWMYIRHSLFL